MSEETKEPYQELYDKFMKDYELGATSSEQVGELVARLAGYYPNYSEEMIKAERSYALITRDEILKTDELTGKAVTAAKAETIAKASQEAFIFKKARTHVQNLDMLIQSAKALQRGLIKEMMHSNL